LYEDLAVKGTTEGADREAFVEMLLAAPEFGVTAVVVEGMHRLARDVVVSEQMIRELSANKIRLYSTEVGVQDMVTHPTDEPGRTFVRQILAAVSQYEKSALVLKLRAARKRKREKTGRCEGKIGYGKTREEVIMLNLVTQLRQGGASWTGITDMLNAAGHRKRNGSKWDAVNLYRVYSAAIKRHKHKVEREQHGHILHVSAGSADQ